MAWPRCGAGDPRKAGDPSRRWRTAVGDGDDAADAFPLRSWAKDMFSMLSLSRLLISATITEEIRIKCTTLRLTLYEALVCCCFCVYLLRALCAAYF